jgi:starvation-inducible outer membrane lipoprotein
MISASITRFVIVAITTLALAGCVSDPNNLNKRADLQYSPELNRFGL